MTNSLKLNPSLLPESETLEYRVQSAIADGDLVVQYLRGNDRIILDVALLAKLGKGLLGQAQVKARSQWVQEEEWIPKNFLLESSLWGIKKRSGFEMQKGELDPLSAIYALRCSPMHEVGEERFFATRDESREKTVRLSVSGKKKSESFLGAVDLLKIEFDEVNYHKERPDNWIFWVESQKNILMEIEIGHNKLGYLSFSLANRRET